MICHFHKYEHLYKIIFLFLLVPSTVFAQSEREKKAIFTQAETYYLYEEYELANQLYILIDDADNFNVKYKIGVCYLNIPDEKAKAIPYLEEAVKSAYFDSKEKNFSEKKAPLDAYFFLAKAYLINNDFDKCYLTLKKFEELSQGDKANGDIKNINFISQVFQACNNAERFMGSPVDISTKILGGGFTDGTINENPVVSFDGSSMAYTERRGMVNVIKYSRKEKGVWTNPIDITETIQAGEDCSTCSFNANGTELYIYKKDKYDGNIYVTMLVNDTWTPIKKLNSNINTKYYESHASISADGKKLYFTSNRTGGFGGLDIYVSEKDKDGNWKPAKNIGNKINTPYNEDTPFITENDSSLFFSSEGHMTIGGFDIFRSNISDSLWGTPKNIGCPINTTDDDKFFCPYHNGNNGYYSMTTGYKEKDIFDISFYPSEGNNDFILTGFVSLGDNVPFAERSILTHTFVNDPSPYSILEIKENAFFINLIDNVSGDTVDVGYPNIISGMYAFKVAPGNYRLIYNGYGYHTHTIDTVIRENQPDPVLIINTRLRKDTSVAPWKAETASYTKVSFDNPKTIDKIDSAMLITNVVVSDVNDTSIVDSEILFYTVQVMALYNPVDVSYFKYVDDMKVMYNETDKFYRYTTGIFDSIEAAEQRKQYLLERGYKHDIFIKKVSKNKY